MFAYCQYGQISQEETVKIGRFIAHIGHGRSSQKQVKLIQVLVNQNINKYIQEVHVDQLLQEISELSERVPGTERLC